MKNVKLINLLSLHLFALSFLSSCTGQQKLGCDDYDLAYQAAARDGNIREMIRLENETEVDQNGCCSINGHEAPIIQAASSGSYDAVKRLIDNGANVNIRKSKIEKVTALMIAAQKGYGYIVQLLLQEGADVNAKSEKGDTALSLAKKANHTNIVELLVNHLKVNGPTWSSASNSGSAYKPSTSVDDRSTNDMQTVIGGAAVVAATAFCAYNAYENRRNYERTREDYERTYSFRPNRYYQGPPPIDPGYDSRMHLGSNTSLEVRPTLNSQGQLGYSVGFTWSCSIQ